MNVEIKLSPKYKDPYAVIFAQEITDEIKNTLQLLQGTAQTKILTAKTENDKIVILEPSKLTMLRSEERRTAVYCEEKRYTSSKPLCEFEELLPSNFLRISKTTIVNMKQIETIEASFKGMMCLVMKNGCKDYISRRYLPSFKHYLGL